MSTRGALLRAGEHLFARHGVGGTRTKQIVERAGQGNDSAVQYHFGSREGLVAAIMTKHLDRMEPLWQSTLPAVRATPEVPVLVDSLLTPLAEELLSEDGRDFLRIIPGVAGGAGVRTHEPPLPLHGTALAENLELLEGGCLLVLATDVGRERIAMAISMITAALADRAHRVDGHLPVLLTHDEFRTNLTTMISAALLAR
ncbi:MAG: helix-turn-helix domain-containing protein [Mycobacteriaceae bacterium]